MCFFSMYVCVRAYKCECEITLEYKTMCVYLSEAQREIGKINLVRVLCNEREKKA